MGFSVCMPGLKGLTQDEAVEKAKTWNKKNEKNAKSGQQYTAATYKSENPDGCKKLAEMALAALKEDPDSSTPVCEDPKCKCEGAALAIDDPEAVAVDQSDGTWCLALHFDCSLRGQCKEPDGKKR